MSELQKLKATIDGIANSARQTGSGLSQFKGKFASQIGQVRSTIGGSAQRKDQEVMHALEAAAKQVEAAVNALESAARTAANYGRSL